MRGGGARLPSERSRQYQPAAEPVATAQHIRRATRQHLDSTVCTVCAFAAGGKAGDLSVLPPRPNPTYDSIILLDAVVGSEVDDGLMLVWKLLDANSRPATSHWCLRQASAA